MTTINSPSPAPSPKTHQSPTNRAAWREEMLGQFLEKMRETKADTEPGLPKSPKIKAHGKGQYLDVYV
ncbi:MAG: hypothetical protein LBF38_07490 [Deltaproteobacteria bacterium]|nr:hypothetical protein [Deltaproteobacteria bacterium]